MRTEEIIRQYLQECKMVQLATVNDNQPWCCSLFCAPTKDLELYWISLPGTRHSRELMRHANVAVTIPVHYMPGKPVVGISAEGTARLVTDRAEIKIAAKRYADYLDRGDTWYEEFVAGKNPHELYCFTPKAFTLFDAEHFPENPRQEFHQ